MINICPKCHNHEWDKEVVNAKKTQIRCPKCGFEWSSKGLPLFILTGCSGVGKTTTLLELMQRDTEFIVLDADYFLFMPSNTIEDWVEHIERQQEISADIMQAGKPVLWAMAGCVDKLHETYHERFFNGIYCLALTCSTEALQDRMINGRGITDEEWLRSSAEYNEYFVSHSSIGDVKFDTLDITGMCTEKVADGVTEWIHSHL